MSYEDVVKSLKMLATLSLGTYSGAALYSMVAVQPSLIEENNIPAASSVSCSSKYFLFCEKYVSHSDFQK